jgi:hypothetical protein
MFSNQKSQFGSILEGLAMKDVGIFCGSLEYCMVIRYIFPRFGMLHKEKSGNPAKHEA